jgi:hypothetical protein
VIPDVNWTMSTRPGIAKPSGGRQGSGTTAVAASQPLSPPPANGGISSSWLTRQQRSWLAAVAAVASLWVLCSALLKGRGGGALLLGVSRQRCRGGDEGAWPLAAPLGDDVRGWQGGTPLDCVSMSSFYQRWIRGDLRRWEGSREAVTLVCINLTSY